MVTKQERFNLFYKVLKEVETVIKLNSHLDLEIYGVKILRILMERIIIIYNNQLKGINMNVSSKFDKIGNLEFYLTSNRGHRGYSKEFTHTFNFHTYALNRTYEVLDEAISDFDLDILE